MPYDLKALTLRHPWPWAIVELGKDIENRTWKPPRAMVGKWFAIHGGKAPKGDRATHDVVTQAQALLSMRGHSHASHRVTCSDVTHAGIVAVVRLGGVVEDSRSVWFEGPYGWVLSDLWKVPDPPQMAGMQGLWDVPESAVMELERQGAPWLG